MPRNILACAVAILLLAAAAQTFTAEAQGRIDFRSGPPGAETASIWGYLALPPGGARVPARRTSPAATRC